MPHKNIIKETPGDVKKKEGPLFKTHCLLLE